jgi:hypothetical protein
MGLDIHLPIGMMFSLIGAMIATTMRDIEKKEAALR